MNWEEIRMKARQWVSEAGMKIRTSLQDDVAVQFKKNRSDLVTEMDKQIEKYLYTCIKDTFPTHRVLGEEGFGDYIDNLDGVVWIIDPIDGTMNFVHMKRHFAISVGIYEHGIGKIGIIYDVFSDELYEAEKGKGAFVNDQKIPLLANTDVEDAVISVNASWALKEEKLAQLVKAVRGSRSIGSAAIEMAFVATNRTDAYLTMRLSPWDFAAGKIILEEVGAKVTTLDGEPLQLLKESSCFVGKAHLHGEIMKRFLRL